MFFSPGWTLRRISVSVCLALAPWFVAAQPSTDPSPAGLKIPNKQPQWKVSPGGANHFINSVGVSADGSRVVGGTFFHKYGGKELRVDATPSPNQPPEATDRFGVYCYSGGGALEWKDEFEAWQGVYWTAISADGSRAAAGGFMTERAPQGFVRIYDAADQGKILLSEQTDQRVNQVALSQDGTWAVAVAGTLRLYHGAKGPGAAPMARTDEFMPNHTEGIVSVGLSQDGGTVVYSDFAGNVGVFANEAGKLKPQATWRVPGGTKYDFCHMIALSPDVKYFTAGGANGLFYYFDVAKLLATGQPTYRHATDVKGAVYGVAMAEDGGMFAGVVNQGDAGEACLLRVANGGARVEAQLALKRNPNYAVLNSARGLLAISDGHPDGTPGHYYVFDCGTPGVVHLRWIFETKNMSWPIAVSASGNAVVGGSDDTNIYYFTP